MGHAENSERLLKPCFSFLLHFFPFALSMGAAHSTRVRLQEVQADKDAIRTRRNELLEQYLQDPRNTCLADSFGEAQSEMTKLTWEQANLEKRLGQCIMHLSWGERTITAAACQHTSLCLCSRD